MDWRRANICSILKSGYTKTAGNYRPISLTSVVSKLMEHILYTSIVANVDSERLICENQRGFRKGRSCETQLAIFVHELHESLDNRHEVNVIFLDFAKAFDIVPHKRLLI